MDGHLRAERLVFAGHIAGFGTGSGVRMVIGCWDTSPFGAFTDVMVQSSSERVLLAPDPRIAEFVSSTYRFDRIDLGSVTASWSPDRLAVTAPGLDVRLDLGGPAPIDRLLRLVPRRLATAPWWLRAVDPIAARIVPGVHTAGTAGDGRREYYGVQRSRRVVAVDGRFGGRGLGRVAPLSPPVSFGFASAPATPQLVTVTTTIDVS